MTDFQIYLKKFKNKQKMNRSRIIRCLPLLILFLITPILTGCAQGVSADNSVSISGAGDLWNLSQAINTEATKDTNVPQVNFNISDNSINDLKQGKTDAVFLGREPTAEELKGLQDYVIAYDAVCIIIDDNSFDGGSSQEQKNTGLQNLTLENLKDIFSGVGWNWSGYYVDNTSIDRGSWLWKDPSVAWLPEPKPIVPDFIFPIAKYDTQTVLYQDLGLDEKSMLSERTSFTSPKYNKEEEVLAYEYTGSNYGTVDGVQNFAFKLGFASRRVMTIAPQHVPVSVITIDGINPLTDSQSVYTGTYPLTRKIHILVRDNAPANATQLLKYLQSDAGQQMLATDGYLPLIPQ
jgi:ABC-type phosphate transport system substrate-binding protein